MTRDELLAAYKEGKRDFRGADLGGANLRGADLGGANLGGADLGGADLGKQWIIQGPTRSDGWFFVLTSLTDEGVRIKAGCRNFPPAEAIAHWEKTRGGTSLGEESLAIVRHLLELARIRGYKMEEGK
jgi:uncharacterized protein YjbI with pentapeptide repeats